MTITAEKGTALPARTQRQWRITPMGKSFSDSGRADVMKNRVKIHPDRPAATLTANSASPLTHWLFPNMFSRMQAIRIQTFPDDYNFLRQRPTYVCGMSVPPRMMERVAATIHAQFFSCVSVQMKTGPWKIADIADVKQNGYTVFSCFHGGGGSSFGYKLAGYNVLGGVEIDPKMMELYRANHHPKYSYMMSVRDFLNIPDDELPSELQELDVLDGSPPCSSFSMAGSREKAWGTKKQFREGQSEQILDDLFLDFIRVAKKLQPKIVIAENVKGLIQGNARGYVKEIFKHFRDAGYDVQLFLLNASRMGVPQVRERTFFIANRIGKRLHLEFNEPPITVRQAWSDLPKQEYGKSLPLKTTKWWSLTPKGGRFSDTNRTDAMKPYRRLDPNQPAWTQTATGTLMHWEKPRHLSRMQAVRTSNVSSAP